MDHIYISNKQCRFGHSHTGVSHKSQADADRQAQMAANACQNKKNN